MSAFAWAFVFAVVAVLVGMFLGWLWGLLAAYREDRRREAAYADAWVRTHRQRQADDRYVTDEPGRPE